MNCTIVPEVVGQSRCRLFVHIDSNSGDSNTDWQFVSFDIPGLALKECKKLSGGRLAMDFDRSSEVIAEDASSVSGVLKFSHNDYLPFERAVTVRWNVSSDPY